jgi:hypothetical protein
MPSNTSAFSLSPELITSRISNISQLGGIETSVMDNGYARGVRIAWFNTASGLRYKVVLDRAMDIADAFFNQYGLAWHSSAGIMPPQIQTNRGADWLRTFGGGLVTTCGLSHVGGPETDEYGERGLHGWISNCPAEIESIVQPDPSRGLRIMSITGRIKEARIFGPHLELRRTISSSLGESWIDIADEVTNLGNTAAPHMLLYHFNLGWPLVDEGAELKFDGRMYYVNEARDRSLFNDERNFKVCPAPMKEHSGNGEAAAYFDLVADGDGICTCGIDNIKLGLRAEIRFRKDQLRWMTNWQHWAPGEYVTGLEPGTHPPIGQAAARKNETLLFIEPGASMKYNLRFQVFSER